MAIAAETSARSSVSRQWSTVNSEFVYCKMATRNLTAYVDDITLCPICLEDYRDPRSLPCLHTFCVRCIERLGEGKSPGAEMPCAVCREVFEIPQGGLGQLRHNFFIEGLVNNKAIGGGAAAGGRFAAGGVAETCQGCGMENAPATTFCVDCKQRLCESCGRRCQRLTQPHSVVRLGEESGALGMRRHRGNYCDIHRDVEATLYCRQCGTVACERCTTAQHRGHRCVNITEVARGFAARISSDSAAFGRKLARFSEKGNEIERARESFSENVRQAESGIMRTADEIKKLVDKEAANLLNDLQAKKGTALKMLEHEKESVDMSVTALRSFIEYSRNLVEKGTACDIVRAVNDLRERAIELEQFPVDDTAQHVPEVVFTPRNVIEQLKSCDGSMLGGLSANSDRSSEEASKRVALRRRGSLLLRASRQSTAPEALDRPYLRHPDSVSHLTVDGDVYGVATLDNKTFVVVSNSDSVHVLGPNSEHLTDIRVPGMRQPWDIVACADARSLYVADYWSRDAPGIVWRVTPDGAVRKFLPSATTTSTTTMFRPWSLSVTSARLLVTSKNELLLYGVVSGASEIQRTVLPDIGAQHAVETSRDTFVVCHWKPRPGVREYDRDGHVIVVYDDRVQQLSKPCHVTYGGQGKLLVADNGTHRVLLLGGDLQLERVLLDAADDGGLMRGPHRLCYVGGSGRLIVGCTVSHSVQVFCVQQGAELLTYSLPNNQF